MMENSRAKDKLVADFNAVMRDIDALMKATGQQAEGEARALRERIRDRLDGAKERILDVQHETVQRAKAAATATDDYVHDNPWQAIGIGAAVGLVAGVLLARR